MRQLLILISLIFLQSNLWANNVQPASLVCVNSRNEVMSLALNQDSLKINNNLFLVKDDYSQSVNYDRNVFSLYNNDDLDVLVPRALILNSHNQINRANIVVIDYQSEQSENLECSSQSM